MPDKSAASRPTLHAVELENGEIDFQEEAVAEPGTGMSKSSNPATVRLQEAQAEQRKEKEQATMVEEKVGEKTSATSSQIGPAEAFIQAVRDRGAQKDSSRQRRAPMEIRLA
jgi:hypothetical protein